MDDYDHLDLDEITFAPMDDVTERLALLTLQEAHDLLQLLLAIAQDGHPLSPQADRLAREIAARIPSETDRPAAASVSRAYRSMGSAGTWPDLAAPHHTPDGAGAAAFAIRRSLIRPRDRVDARHEDIATVHVAGDRAVRLGHRPSFQAGRRTATTRPVTSYLVMHAAVDVAANTRTEETSEASGAISMPAITAAAATDLKIHCVIPGQPLRPTSVTGHPLRSLHQHWPPEEQRRPVWHSSKHAPGRTTGAAAEQANHTGIPMSTDIFPNTRLYPTGYCVIFAKNITPGELLARAAGRTLQPTPIGREEADTITMLDEDISEDDLPDLDPDALQAAGLLDADGPLLRAGQYGDWSFAVESEGPYLADVEVLRTVSRGTTALSACELESGSSWIAYAENGVCLSSFDPLFPDDEHGTDPSRLEQLTNFRQALSSGERADAFENALQKIQQELRCTVLPETDAGRMSAIRISGAY